MKEFLLALAAIICFSAPAGAQVSTQAQAVKLVLTWEMACSSQTIGTSAVEMTGNTSVSSTTAAKSYIAVMNLDTANTVYCSSNSAVASSGNDIGWPIAPSAASGARNWFQWTIAATQKWYCIASAANTSIMKCLGR